MSLTPQIQPIEVLLVDDDQADVLLTTRMLKRGQIVLDVTVAHDGEQALSLLKERSTSQQKLPDIILLDINMPRMNGFEVLQAIRAEPDLHLVPVVMLTTSDAHDDIRRVYELKANCYVTKPVTFEQFQHAIKTLSDFWFTIVRLPSPIA